MKRVSLILMLLVSTVQAVSKIPPQVPGLINPWVKRAQKPKPAPTVRPQAKIESAGSRVLPINDRQKAEFSAWQKKYGFSESSHIYYNIAMLMAIADRQADRVNMVISRADPNSLANLVVENHKQIDRLQAQIDELTKMVTMSVDPNQLDPNTNTVSIPAIGTNASTRKPEEAAKGIKVPEKAVNNDPNNVSLDDVKKRLDFLERGVSNLSIKDCTNPFPCPVRHFDG